MVAERWGWFMVEPGFGVSYSRGVRILRYRNREDSVSVDVAWVSKHAMERYRLHFPEAVATDVMAAIELSITLPTHLADALAGRRRRTSPVEGEERLLHPAGTGMLSLIHI